MRAAGGGQPGARAGKRARGSVVAPSLEPPPAFLPGPPVFGAASGSYVKHRSLLVAGGGRHPLPPGPASPPSAPLLQPRLRPPPWRAASWGGVGCCAGASRWLWWSPDQLGSSSGGCPLATRCRELPPAPVFPCSLGGRVPCHSRALLRPPPPSSHVPLQCWGERGPPGRGSVQRPGGGGVPRLFPRHLLGCTCSSVAEGDAHLVPRRPVSRPGPLRRRLEERFAQEWAGGGSAP